ncbi:DUF488 domain-containing protein [Roseomonas marmotae]|uniref:DUF488 domain-containing protein n=1 Tax=Roseomonas marmotae TaxID=2768161 RepID=A0ABS3KDA3_9PROT|nr:DUF488 domain-containing protein [Roseomonas marmotae]MBO1075443.1 DUF488 domain-containing protein [Roseomonas marmotae]QTI81396.1 DUF488 domain-containing protein [Roseomonas marmotae]
MRGDPPFYTVGHSTRSVEELADLLRQAGADLVVDVRTIPRSRTNPQFNADTLPDALATWQIGYRHLRKLGGLRGHRKDQPPSRNTFWENRSFRNYADYTATPDFREGMAALHELGRDHVCAMMCAEAVWWRCHRRIIADYLLAGGDEVFHILGAGKVERATLNTAAVRGPDGTLVYPGHGP